MTEQSRYSSGDPVLVAGRYLFGPDSLGEYTIGFSSGGQVDVPASEVYPASTSSAPVSPERMRRIDAVVTEVLLARTERAMLGQDPVRIVRDIVGLQQALVSALHAELTAADGSLSIATT